MTLYELKKIPGYDYYWIDNLGEVWSTAKGPMSRLKKAINKDGYFQIVLQGKGRKLRTARVHRLVAENFLPKVIGKDLCCHKDGNRKNNTPGNLYGGTVKENHEDMIRHGTRMVGEKKPNAILSDDKVRFAKRAYSLGISKHDIAHVLSVNLNTLSSVLYGYAWNHIKVDWLPQSAHFIRK